MNVSRAALFVGPLLGLVVGLLMAAGGWDRAAIIVASLTVVCAIWWVFEPIPIPATSLIPLGVFPLLGVLNGEQVALSYGNSLIILLLGGFMLSKAMEKSGAHRRIALGMVHAFGSHSSRRLVFGFMMAAAVLSMWISNTATSLMLLPVALAIIEQAKDRKIEVPLLLGIAYAASVGGIGTPIGTPPNVIFLNIYSEMVGTEPSFLQWMQWGVPVVICFVPIMALWLTRNLHGGGDIHIPQTGPWRSEEVRVLLVFVLTAIAWMTLKEPFGGWSTWLDLPTANNGAVALTAVIIMFLVPNGKGGRLLDWDTAKTIPWGVLLLFSGGIAIAKAFIATGISASLGNILAGMAGLPLFALIVIACLSVTFLTEVTSNTATTTLLMPILAAAGLGAGIEPALLMVPAAMSASCAFMLPVATAPNAVVFGTGRLRVKTMAREGFALNLIGAAIISGLMYWLLG